MIIALGQMSVDADKHVNLKTIERQAADAAGRGAELIVFPEAAMRPFGDPTESLVGDAEQLDGEFVSSLASLAREQGLAIVAGVFESVPEEDRVYNTAVALAPDGGMLGSYRKIHLFDSFGFRESDRFLPGPLETTVFRLAGMNIGLLTCYDLRFPELARLLATRDADVLALPAAWVHGALKEEHWSILARARAIENTVYVAAAGQAGGIYSGRSMVVDPMGVITAALGEEDGVLVAEISRSRIEAAREKLPALHHQRIPLAEMPAAARW
jgi:deaminated glutathione amidase